MPGQTQGGQRADCCSCPSPYLVKPEMRSGHGGEDERGQRLHRGATQEVRKGLRNEWTQAEVGPSAHRDHRMTSSQEQQSPKVQRSKGGEECRG